MRVTILVMAAFLGADVAAAQRPYGGSEHQRTPAGPVDLYYPDRGVTDVPKRRKGPKTYFQDKRMRPQGNHSKSGGGSFRWQYGTSYQRY